MKIRRLAAALVLWLTACAGEPDPQPPPPAAYLHNRIDYLAFRETRPEIEGLEPNYLPFMAHFKRLGAEEGDVLLFCRWAEDRFPLAVHVTTPKISDELQDEFRPRQPAAYVAAVKQSLQVFEDNLEGLVTFHGVDSASEADLTIQLHGVRGPRPEPNVRVFGTTPIGGACRVRDAASENGRVSVQLEVPEIDIYLADSHGLLTPAQIHVIGIHEVGHALGMRSHSPVPADLMYEQVRDRLGVDGLSTEDVNSFVALYQVPNGTVYRRLPKDGQALPDTLTPPGPPTLEIAPHVDARLGLEMQTPKGWIRVVTDQGFVAVDGVSWDYVASFQVIVRRYASFETYLDRHAAAHVGTGEIVEQGPIEVVGHRGFRLVVEHADDGYRDRLSFIETGDGRLLVVIADSPLELAEAYAPWFDAALATLELSETAAGGHGEERDYRPHPVP